MVECRNSEIKINHIWNTIGNLFRKDRERAKSHNLIFECREEEIKKTIDGTHSDTNTNTHTESESLEYEINSSIFTQKKKHMMFEAWCPLAEAKKKKKYKKKKKRRKIDGILIIVPFVTYFVFLVFGRKLIVCCSWCSLLLLLLLLLLHVM